MKKRIIIILSIIAAVMLCMFLFGRLFSEKEIITSVDKYEQIMGQEGRFKNNLVAYNSIWPDSLDADIEVERFYYEYNNVWDPNYLGYMQVIYGDSESYQAEIDRLKSIDSTEYLNKYGITGFSKELCAVISNDYGVIYALTDGVDEISYISIEFCNYFSDIKDYGSIIAQEDLPMGLDISEDNPTRMEFENTEDD